MRESEVAKLVRLALQKSGVTLFRNLVGKFQAINPRSGDTQWVECGLGVGSSDFIGWTEHKVRPEDVGRVIAVFTAIETKRSTGGVKSEAQIAFVGRVREVGGIAGFAESPAAAVQILEEFNAV